MQNELSNLISKFTWAQSEMAKYPVGLVKKLRTSHNTK